MISQSPEERQFYEARLKFLHDAEARLIAAREEGACGRLHGGQDPIAAAVAWRRRSKCSGTLGSAATRILHTCCRLCRNVSVQVNRPSDFRHECSSTGCWAAVAAGAQWPSEFRRERLFTACWGYSRR